MPLAAMPLVIISIKIYSLPKKYIWQILQPMLTSVHVLMVLLPMLLLSERSKYLMCDHYNKVLTQTSYSSKPISWETVQS